MLNQTPGWLGCQLTSPFKFMCGVDQTCPLGLNYFLFSTLIMRLKIMPWNPNFKPRHWQVLMQVRVTNQIPSDCITPSQKSISPTIFKLDKGCPPMADFPLSPCASIYLAVLLWVFYITKQTQFLNPPYQAHVSTSSLMSNSTGALLTTSIFQLQLPPLPKIMQLLLLQSTGIIQHDNSTLIYTVPLLLDYGQMEELTFLTSCPIPSFTTCTLYLLLSMVLLSYSILKVTK